MFEQFKEQLLENGTVTFTVRVRPGAHGTRVKEILSDGSIKIDLAAIAEYGKANTELILFLSEEFNVPKSSVEILSGQTARTKVVRISARA